MDVEGFVSFLTDDACFRFANSPVVYNKKNIRNVISDFFTSIKSLHHYIIDVWVDANVLICEGKVTYTRHDDKKLTLPFVNIMRMQDELIADYRIFIDLSALYA